MKFENLILYRIDLRLFDGDMNLNKTTDTTATTGNDLSTEMKTFYSVFIKYPNFRVIR